MTIHDDLEVRSSDHDGDCCPCVPGLQQAKANWRRHAERLHRRLDQGTDRASLEGEVRKLASQLTHLQRKTAVHLEGRCKDATRKANAKLDALVETVGREIALPVLAAFEERWSHDHPR